jgi:LAO/AO transport system kinase
MSNKKDSFLKIKSGIEQPSSINEKAVEKFLNSKQAKLSADEFVKGIRNFDRAILGQAITLIESTLPKHNNLAQQIIEKCLPFAGKSIRIGITGVPGAGKSTFIEALGKHITGLGHKLAVLAIDPSSALTKGSILGDKTRMEQLSTDRNAFIRPSPTSGTLGGVARKTREIIILCEAAGFDVVFIETVGVGQSETLVHSMVDYFLLLMIAGAGDELQGIKRGIMEMADTILINKSDGDNITKAQSAKRDYENALHLFPLPESGWKPLVDVCSAYNKTGIDKAWNTIQDYQKFTLKNGYFKKKRENQAKYMMLDYINRELSESFYINEEVKKLIHNIEKDILSNKMTSYTAARKLLDVYFKQLKK